MYGPDPSLYNPAPTQLQPGYNPAAQPFVPPGHDGSSNEPEKKNELCDLFGMFIFIGIGVGIGFGIWGVDRPPPGHGALLQTDIFKCENDHGNRAMVFPGEKMNFYVAQELCRSYNQQGWETGHVLHVLLEAGPGELDRGKPDRAHDTTRFVALLTSLMNITAHCR